MEEMSRKRDWKYEKGKDIRIMDPQKVGQLAPETMKVISSTEKKEGEERHLVWRQSTWN